MKQFLLALTVLVSGFATAQTITPGTPVVTKTATSGPSIAASVSDPRDQNRVVADTLFPAALSLECAGAPTLFFSDTSGTMGYVTGSNQFADFEKLQRVTLPEAVDVTVKEVVVAFAVAEDSIENRQIVINIYTDLGADGSFGTLAGTSDTLLVADLAISDSTLVFTSFPFSTPAVMEGVSSFLISVDVSGVYFNENGDFDPKGNVGIFSTPSECGDGTNLFEIFPNDAGGLSFNSVFNNWGMLNIEMFVGAVVDRGTFTSTRTQTADFEAKAFPNPVQDELTVSFEAPSSGDYQLRVVSAAGAMVSQQQVNTVRGTTRAAVDVAGLSAGVYLFQVEGVNGVQTGRFVKR